MKLPAYLRRSIGLTQAVIVLLASLLVSLTLGALQLGYTFLDQKEAAMELSEEILSLAQGGATTASWTLDNQLAADLIQSVIALGDVQAATLRDEKGDVLATAERAERHYGALTTLFARTFIGKEIRGTRQLTVSSGNRVQMVGTFTIILAPEQIAGKFLAVATPGLIAGLLEALAIGIILLWLSSRLVTSPLQRAAAAVAEIDPENPGAGTIHIPPFHADNELGHLLGHTNQMVERLGSVQEQLRTLATQDPLTGLPNRSCVVTRLDRALARAKRNNGLVAVLFLDLDGFKIINDSHGHGLGDVLLIKVAGRLRTILRSNDAVGRLGGDEFLIVMEGIANATDVVPTIQRIIGLFAEPFIVGSIKADIACSIGVAVFPEDGADASTLMRHSDLAMYQAKRAKGNQYHFFAKSMSDELQTRINTETALRNALDRDEFKLSYQPKIDATSGDLAGCEVLLRWQRADRLVPAGEFIHVAEETGMMVEIGRMVLEKACAQAHEWASRNAPISIAVNVSAQQLREARFADLVIDTANFYEVPPGMIELEITETVLIEELDHAIAKLQTLRAAGFGVSIDDFGTGYSSLSYLTHLPANSLKIDRSFVSGPKRSEVVLNMIIAMAHSLGLTTVAEGIETEEQRGELVAKGCDTLQGYLLGRPVPAKEFEEMFLSQAA